MKSISITLADWVYDKYIKDANNKSRRIEELIIKGGSIDSN